MSVQWQGEPRLTERRRAVAEFWCVYTRSPVGSCPRQQVVQGQSSLWDQKSIPHPTICGHIRCRSHCLRNYWACAPCQRHHLGAQRNDASHLIVGTTCGKDAASGSPSDGSKERGMLNNLRHATAVKGSDKLMFFLNITQKDSNDDQRTFAPPVLSEFDLQEDLSGPSKP